jgi:hypothetical protein
MALAGIIAMIFLTACGSCWDDPDHCTLQPGDGPEYGTSLAVTRAARIATETAAATSIPPTATPIDIESEMSQVYTLALESYCGSRDVFLEPTTIEYGDGRLDAGDYEYLVQKVPTFERSTLDNFVIANREREPLPQINYGRSVEFMTSTEFLALFDIQPGDEWWDRFHDEYPNGCGYAALSGIGFNTETTQAIVHLYASSGSFGCIYEDLVMQKESGEWQITNELIDSIC